MGSIPKGSSIFRSRESGGSATAGCRCFLPPPRAAVARPHRVRTRSLPTQRWIIATFAAAAAAAGAWILWPGGPRSVALGPARWFVLGPGERAIAVGRPNGDLAFLDAAGRELAPPLAGSAAAGVVFLGDGRALVVRGGDRSGVAEVVCLTAALEPGPAAVRVEVPAGTELRPLLPGAARRGTAAAGTPLLLEAAGGGGVQQLYRCDVATGAVEVLELDLGERTLRLVSSAPDGAWLALYLADGGGSCELVLRSLRDGRSVSAGSADPVLPYWLRDSGALLFSRQGTAIYRMHPDDAKPLWMCDGTFALDALRSQVAFRVPGEPVVVFERVGADGLLQIARLWPYATEGHRTVQISTGNMDHYGHDVSQDFRFVAWRQAQLEGRRTGAVEERLVAIDQQRGVRALALGNRTGSLDESDTGPSFGAGGAAVYCILDGELCRFDLTGRAGS